MSKMEHLVGMTNANLKRLHVLPQPCNQAASEDQRCLRQRGHLPGAKWTTFLRQPRNSDNLDDEAGLPPFWDPNMQVRQPNRKRTLCL